jgi:ATP synthase protein I
MDRKENMEFRKRIEDSVRSYKTSRSQRREFWRHVSRVTVAGWLFVIPVVAGAYLGRYLDKKFITDISWTITLIIIGIAVGIYNVWHFIHEKGE